MGMKAEVSDGLVVRSIINCTESDRCASVLGRAASRTKPIMKSDGRIECYVRKPKAEDATAIMFRCLIFWKNESVKSGVRGAARLLWSRSLHPNPEWVPSCHNWGARQRHFKDFGVEVPQKRLVSVNRES